MKKFLLSTLLLVLTGFALFAQVTTGSLTGTVKDSKETLIGATVKATHVPSGTTYAASTKADGKFTLLNLRVGGPYTIQVSYIGYQPQTYENITVKLGEPAVLNVTLSTSGTELREVTIAAADPNSVLNADKKGATTNISRAMIQSLPSITRSVNDLTRLTPQANGTSIGGGNYRSNNFSVDGANFNNQFGIGQNVPAGGSPISLDALEQISINVTPYDVRQTGFTGAAINAVTRSGTNTFSGTGFYLARSQYQQGSQVGNFRVAKQKYDQKQYGVSVGGPIIKNKLFFFLNGEFSDVTQPGPTRVAATAAAPFGSNSNVTRPTDVFLNSVSDYLRTTYGYETGPYQGYQNQSNNDKLLARIDWNISSKHRLALRYNQVESKSPSTLSSSTTNSGVTYGSAVNRTSNQALSFQNSNYFQEANLYSFSGELTSTLGSFTNLLRGTMSHQNDPRSSPGTEFPFVDILDTGTPITSFGYESFTYGNLRDVRTFTYTDELSTVLGKHSATAGVQFETSTTKNGFQRYGTGFYTFASWNDFITNQRPTNYALTYPLTADGSQAYPSFKFNQWSLYLQDAFSASDKLKLTGGVRFELPSYPDVTEVQTHPLVAGLTFANGEKINTGVLPKTRVMVSPRIGFNYDIKGDRSLQLRGGSGIFTGRIPFVWIVSQSGDAGMLQFLQVFTGSSAPLFSPDIKANIPATKPAAGTSIPASISAMSPNLKFPSTWKSSLAFDVKLPGGIVGTLEGIYQKDINAVYARNANLNNPSELNVAGYPDNRPIFPGNSSNAAGYYARQVNSLTSAGQVATSAATTSTAGFAAIVMDNAKGGHYISGTAQLNKQFGRGLSATVAYTKSNARNYGDGGGDQIANLWSYPYTSTNSNTPSLGYTSNILPDRVIASVSYRAEFLKHLATNISLFYEGASQGKYSYYYQSDFNRDGQVNDLIYVPKDPSEITFTAIPAGTSGYRAAGYTAQEQSDIFFAYIDQDPYLKTRKGQYAERNGAKLPWRNQVDVRIAQDLLQNFGKIKNSLQFTVDIFNVGNLLTNRWGHVNFVNNAGILIPQNANSLTAGGTTRPTFRMAANQGDIVRTSFGTTQTIASTYYMQFGVRYNFN